MKKVVVMFFFLLISTQQVLSLTNGDYLIIKYTRENNIKELEKILSKGTADINAKDDINKFSALTFASIYGYTDIAKLLIDNGFDVNSVDNVR